jgi:hypothetical protein
MIKTRFKHAQLAAYSGYWPFTAKRYRNEAISAYMSRDKQGNQGKLIQKRLAAMYKRIRGILVCKISSDM